MRQQSWLETYQAIDAISSQIRNQGEATNLIYSKYSWFRAKRHLNKLHFDRLIRFDPERNNLIVMEGTDKGTLYTPQAGDLLFTIDRDSSTLKSLLERWPTKLLYKDINDRKNGLIYRIQP